MSALASILETGLQILILSWRGQEIIIQTQSSLYQAALL